MKHKGGGDVNYNQGDNPNHQGVNPNDLVNYNEGDILEITMTQQDDGQPFGTFIATYSGNKWTKIYNFTPNYAFGSGFFRNQNDFNRLYEQFKDGSDDTYVFNISYYPSQDKLNIYNSALENWNDLNLNGGKMRRKRRKTMKSGKRKRKRRRTRKNKY